MRTGRSKWLTGLVLTLVLGSSVVLPLAAVALPVPVQPYMAVEDVEPPPAAASPVIDTPAAGDLRLPIMGPVDRTGAAGASDLAIPDVVLAAYRNAARMASEIAPGCDVDWAVLAGIGKVESRHGLHFGADSVIDTQGTVRKPIIGPVLNGTGRVSSITDSDGGRWDGDTAWDRAVGPMQFIPSSWRRYGQDGNGDGIRDPHNVFDAALAAAAHLCGTAAVDLSDDGNLERALYSYNHSEEYVETVRGWIGRYRATDPSDVPSVVVRTELPDGPVSPFPTPGEHIAGGFGLDALPSTATWSRPNATTPRPSVGTSGRAVDQDPKAPARAGNGTNPTKKATTPKDPGNKPTKPKPDASATPSATPSEPGSETPSEAVRETPSAHPSEPSSGTPSAEPSEAPSQTPTPAPSETTPADSAKPPADPDPGTQPAPDPDPEPTPSPKPEPTPEPEPSPTPEPEPTAAPVDFSARPTVTYLGSTASEWPKACRPAALWAGVVDDAVADQIVIATGVAQPAKGDALTVSWRTARDTVWRVTTHGCETGEVTQGSTSA